LLESPANSSVRISAGTRIGRLLLLPVSLLRRNSKSQYCRFKNARARTNLRASFSRGARRRVCARGAVSHAAHVHWIRHCDEARSCTSYAGKPRISCRFLFSSPMRLVRHSDSTRTWQPPHGPTRAAREARKTGFAPVQVMLDTFYGFSVTLMLSLTRRLGARG